MIEIKRFNLIDLRSFQPNEFSDPAEVQFAMTDPKWDIFTMWENNKVEAIICARRYWGNNYMAFFLISATFRTRNAARLRQWIHGTYERFNVKRIQTDSQANEMLDAWHRFMGFTLEGRREKMMHGKDYHCWGLNLGV